VGSSPSTVKGQALLIMTDPLGVAIYTPHCFPPFCFDRYYSI